MSEKKKKEEREDHEVTDEQLEDVSGGVVAPITDVTTKSAITESVEGESSDKDHKNWTDI